MVDLYKKYYLDSETIKEILQNGIVVFDTSALLDLYSYSSETRNEIFNKAFNYLKGRLWIPAQVYFEYLKNKMCIRDRYYAMYCALIIPLALYMWQNERKRWNGCVLGPVSYTHLDVYKRQLWCRAPPRKPDLDGQC